MLAYGNFKGRSEICWQKCIDEIGFVKKLKELKSIIKQVGTMLSRACCMCFLRLTKSLLKTTLWSY